MSELHAQFERLIADAPARLEYEHELALGRFTESLARTLTERGLTQSDLARILSVSRARVSQVMRHESSPTLRTMVEMAAALGCDIETRLVARDAVAEEGRVERTASLALRA
jgi:transcriptional regulator with XRE-family HTH domain